jgi:SAM-dependent methyltransferase
MRAAGPARMLFTSPLGLSILGVDVAETALAIAREKADDRGIEVEFAAADAFQLERLARRFETVLDCGLFHTFDGDERPRYVASLASVTEHDGTLYVLCFSDDGPDTGPHPISQEELSAAFQPQQWMECHRHRTGPDADEIPRRRRTGLVRDNQTDLDGGTGRPGERSRAVTHGSHRSRPAVFAVETALTRVVAILITDLSLVHCRTAAPSTKAIRPVQP